MSQQLLTDDELVLLDLLKQVANGFQKVTFVADGSQVVADWTEVVHEINHLKHRVMSQAAARAYPGRFRLLGGDPILQD